MAEAILRSPSLTSLEVSPGNPGTTAHNIDLDTADHAAVVDHCVSSGVDLVVVGPENPLVAGIADALAVAGIKCFGPSARAARLEGSKTFTRDFAERHGIPGPRIASFTEVDAALAWLDEVDFPVVVKADGLASGKGVVLPENRVETERAIFGMLAEGSMGAAGARVVLEECMVGPEISLIAFCDGVVARALPPAQDHKRVGEGDTGPNTGGMGAFAPVPGFDDEQLQTLSDQFLQATVDGMAAEASPFIGMLYAGLMMTDDGPRLIEYNCRFGDPEAQILLPLVESDVLAVMMACTDGSLGELELKISSGTTATVVVAAEGYPDAPVRGIPIPSVDASERTQIIHAGTADSDGTLVSSGGRVLNVVGRGHDLASALDAAYEVVDTITAVEPRLFARADIGWRHGGRSNHGTANSAAGHEGNLDMGHTAETTETDDAYASAGVSFSAGDAAIEQIAEAVKQTHTDRVVAGVGSFGGVFDLAGLGIEHPLLVSSTDTCGTKTVLAAELGMWDGIGADIVNHGVNDVLVQGARPLFMLDTISAGRLDPDIVGTVVRSMAAACSANECVLLGGETAEVPDLIVPGGVDVAGTMVGVVDRSKLLPSPDIAAGDVLIGLASSGLHTNGYSLARKLGASHGYETPVEGSDVPLGEALLAPHRSYLAPLADALDAGLVKSLAHLTGGGFPDNIPRCLPPGLGAHVDTSTWETPPLFRWLQAEAGIGLVEAHRIWNMGIGMVAIVAPGDVEAFRAAVPEETYVVGSVTDQPGVVLV